MTVPESLDMHEITRLSYILRTFKFLIKFLCLDLMTADLQNVSRSNMNEDVAISNCG